MEEVGEMMDAVERRTVYERGSACGPLVVIGLLSAAITYGACAGHFNLPEREKRPEEEPTKEKMEEGVQRFADKVMARSDLDKDGRVRGAEIRASPWKNYLRDANGDGYITREDIVDSYRSRPEYQEALRRR